MLRKHRNFSHVSIIKWDEIVLCDIIAPRLIEKQSKIGELTLPLGHRPHSICYT